MVLLDIDFLDELLKKIFGTLNISPYCLLASNSPGKKSANNIIGKNCISIILLFSSRISFWFLCMFSVFLLIFIFFYILPFSHFPCLPLAVWVCIKLFKNICLVDLPEDCFRKLPLSLCWDSYCCFTFHLPLNRSQFPVPFYAFLPFVGNYSFKYSSVIILETRLSSFPRACWGFCFVLFLFLVVVG